MWLNKLSNSIVKRNKNKEDFTLTTSVSPTGIIHIGKLRDISIVYFLSQQLKKEGFSNKTILYWDDFDVFYKNKEDKILQNELGKPLYLVSKNKKKICENYKKIFLSELKCLGIEFDQVISQADRYNKGKYQNYVKLIDEKKIEILEILKSHLPDISLNRYPILKMYCNNCDKVFDIYGIKETIQCEHCGHSQSPLENINKIKMPFFLEWPARWNYDHSDFEPIGKDHATVNGVFYRSKDILEQVYIDQVPVVQRFEFVGGARGEKMSVSNKKGFTITDLLDILPSELILWVFYKKKPQKYLVLDIFDSNNYLDLFIEFQKKYVGNDTLVKDFETLIDTDLSKYAKYSTKNLKEIFHMTSFIDYQADLNKFNLIYEEKSLYSNIINYYLNYKRNSTLVLKVDNELLILNKHLIIKLKKFLMDYSNFSYTYFSNNLKKNEISEKENVKIIKRILFGEQRTPALSKMIYIYSESIKNLEV